MKNNLILVTALLLVGINPSTAGSLSNGAWSASGCGNLPEAPTLDDSDINAYNQSVAAINDWQQKSKTYFECVVQEANSDNKLIVDSTSQAQAKYRAALEKLTANAAAAAKNFPQP